MASSSSSSSPTLTLLDCPADIFQDVFQSLSPRELYVVCLVCKTLRELAEPFLYSRIHWTWLSSKPPPITLLLRTILSNPQLAVYIQSLVLDGNTFRTTQTAGRPAKIQVSRIELEEPIAFIEKANVSYGSFWIQELHNGTLDAFIAVLLSQLSHLRDLSMGPDFAKDNQILGMVLRSALCESVDCGLPRFQRLQKVSFKYGYKEHRVKYMRNTADVLPFFYLPNVKSISASIDNPVAFLWPAKHRPTPSLLTSLCLTSIREGHLGHILSATTGLESLHWEWHYREDLEDQFLNPIIDLALIIEALFHVRNTLTDLSISALNLLSVDAFLHTLTVTGSFNALVDFTRLKKLKIPVQFLMGSQLTAANRFEHVIPKNIEIVSITDSLILREEEELEDEIMYRSIISGAIRSWLEQWRTSTPHLQSIWFLLDYTYDEWDPVMRTELKELGAATGIRLEFINLEYRRRLKRAS